MSFNFFSPSGFFSLWLARRNQTVWSAWLVYLGWLVGAVFLLSWTGWAPSVGIYFLPVAAAPLYLVAVFRGAPPGVTALWLSLGVAAVTATGVVNHPGGVATHGGGFLLDGVSLPYVFLTVTLIPVVLLASLESIRKNQVAYYFWVLFLGGVLTLCFCVNNFLLFYVLFEVLGFPMFLLIGQYGPRPQRVGAAYKFFTYTFVGSAFILPVLVYLQFWVGSTDVLTLREVQFTEYEQVLFFGLCTLPFAVKVPLVPFHLWLPEAHVEAPTPISMLLAGLLLKTGGYAFIRFLLPTFPVGAYLWGPAATAVGLFSVGYASVYALVQVDMKRMIAYASVAHMSLVFLGFFSGVTLTVQGASYLMLAHGYTSAGLFAGIGVLYDRYHTRTIRQYGGLATGMPVFGVLFFILTLGNLSFPFTGGFVGEFLILVGLALNNVWVTLLCGSTVFLSICYSMWLFNRLFYGVVPTGVQTHQELTSPEVGVLAWCTAGCVGLGFTGGSFVMATHACYAQVVYPGSLG